MIFWNKSPLSENSMMMLNEKVPQSAAGVCQENFFVSDDVVSVDRGQNAHFVDGIFSFFVAQFGELHFFQSIATSSNYSF